MEIISQYSNDWGVGIDGYLLIRLLREVGKRGRGKGERGREKGKGKGGKGERFGAQCPMTNAQCPMTKTISVTTEYGSNGY
ncbi:hypothetical protein VF13_28525 [Nostoc linckia z16]|nr:hypothetical protein VF13_28525 [Nostoc linckia z16]